MRTQWGIAARSGVAKLLVRRDGWYQVAAAQLVRAGVRIADSRALQMFVDGRKVPMETSLDGAGRLSRIEFYGTGLDTPTTNTHVYWLVSARHPGTRVPLLTSRTVTDDAPRFFMSTSTYRERILYFSSVLTHGGNNWFGRPLTGQPLDAAIATPDVNASGPQATLEVAVQGTSGDGQTIDVRLNSAVAGRLSVSGTRHAIADFRIPATAIQNGANALELAPSGAAGAASLFDYARLTYSRLYRLHQGSLRFTAPAGATITLSGISPDTPGMRVVDVTSPGAPVELIARSAAGQPGSSIVSIPRSPKATHRLLAFTAATALPASQVTRHIPSSLHSAGNRADLLLVAPASMQQAIQPLVALHRRQGLVVKVVDIQSIVDEFGFGTHGPQALKSFLAWAPGHWRLKPRYVLLAGTASTDPRNYARGAATELAPTKMLDATSAEAPSDDWLVDFSGNGIPGLAIGRLPARTPAELQVMVNKIIGWTPTLTSSRALLVSGAQQTGDSVNFGALSAGLAQLFPAGVSVTSVSAAGTSTDAPGQIVAGINAGPRFVNYEGHGSLDLWDGLLETEDLGELTNGSHLPIFITLTCINGYFVSPATQSLGEALLADPNGGAVAVWSSTGDAPPSLQANLNASFYRWLFAHPGSGLGDAIRQVLPTVPDPLVRRTSVLLGDPTMVVWP